MNKVTLLGRITKDIELRQTASGTAVASFTVAVNRRFAKEGQQQADFINCVAWKQQAEFISKYFSKGSMIAIVGNIQTRTWDDNEGKKHYATEVIVDEVYFTGEKKEANTGENNGDFDMSGFQAFDSTDGDLPF